jgi:hypothetical protein
MQPDRGSTESGIPARLAATDDHTTEVLLRVFTSLEAPSAEDEELLDALFHVFGAPECEDPSIEVQLGLAYDVLQRAPSGFCGSLAAEAANRQAEYLDVRRRTLGPEADIPWDEYDRQLSAVYTAAWAVVDQRSRATDASQVTKATVDTGQQSLRGSRCSRNPGPARGGLIASSDLHDARTHIDSLSPKGRSEYVRSLLRDFLSRGVLPDRDILRLAVGMAVISGERCEDDDQP